MKVSDLVNKAEPFKFEFDGEVLEGEWYKYRTTTPQYWRELKKLEAEIKEETDEAIAEEKSNKAGYRWLCDAIKSWNAEDEQGNPLALTPEVFDQLPGPFILKFGEYLNGLRENPTQNGAASPNGSSQTEPTR